MDEVAARFWAKVDRREPHQCWPWLPGAQGSGNGYGSFWYRGQTRSAHRMAWYLTHGSWPSEQIDHLCHNSDPLCTDQPCAHRLCVNPAHLRQVTSAENQQAVGRADRYHQTCKRGHDLTNPENVYLTKAGKRQCRACRTQRRRESRPDCGHDVALIDSGRSLYCPICMGAHNIKDTCKHGHDLTNPMNIYISPGTGKRQCRPCRNAAARAYRARLS